MKNMRLMGIIIVIIIIILIGYILLYKNKKESRLKYYDIPIIKLVTLNDSQATIKAGLYAYGDITCDGIIDEKDVEFMELLIGSKLSFSEDQKALVDFDRDGEATQRDLKQLRDKIKRSDITYETHTSELVYCISQTEDITDCKWQDNKVFEVEDKTTYYIYAKLGDKISKPYKLEYEKIDFSEIEE